MGRFKNLPFYFFAYISAPMLEVNKMENILERLGYAILYILVGVLVIPWAVFTILIIFILDIFAIFVTGESAVINYIEDYRNQLKE